jgi:hypothetical protein
LPFANQRFFSKPGRAEEEVLNGFPKGTVVMYQVFNKMCKQVVERLAGFGVFLSALRAIGYIYSVAAVLALVVVAKVAAHVIGLIVGWIAKLLKKLT